MPDDSLYPEVEAGAPDAKGAAPVPAEKPEEESGAEPETALVPKSVLGADVAVGQSLTMKVVHVYEDEVEVELTKAGEAKEENTETASPDQQLEAMAGQPPMPMRGGMMR